MRTARGFGKSGATARHQRSLRRGPLVALALLAVLPACALRTLKHDIDLSRQRASIDGTVAIRGGASAPIVVVVEDVRSGRIADLFVLARPAPFFFTLPPGNYRLAAFADLDRDVAYEPGSEPAALLGPTGELTLHAGDDRRVELEIDPGGGTRIPFAVSGLASDGRLEKVPSLQIGTVVAGLDDPRFAEENGRLGLWNPVRFMFEVGGGVYFLEEYDPHKTPVLFVHGATGTPADWKDLVSRLDRRRFQPWFAYYPAAPRLQRVADQLLRALSALLVKYRFERLVVVAHSMGGLVTRAALNEAVRTAGSTRLVRVPAFVSISSPWGGHGGATLGVEYSPVVAPSWEDMAPEAPSSRAYPGRPCPPSASTISSSGTAATPRSVGRRTTARSPWRASCRCRSSVKRRASSASTRRTPASCAAPRSRRS